MRLQLWRFWLQTLPELIARSFRPFSLSLVSVHPETLILGIQP
jgi:hypothetical protein